MSNLTRNTVFIPSNFTEQTCEICGFEDVSVEAMWSEHSRMLKAYGVINDYDSEIHVCLDCVLDFIRTESVQLPDQAPAMYIFPSMIQRMCRFWDEDLVPYMNEHVLQHIRSLRKMDDIVTSAGLESEQCRAWWQGATGCDAALYAALVEKMLETPDRFRDISVDAYVRRESGIDTNTLLAPAVRYAEQFRKHQLPLFVNVQETCSFLLISTDNQLF